jgi:hypothetical protein
MVFCLAAMPLLVSYGETVNRVLWPKTLCHSLGLKNPRGDTFLLRHESRLVLSC